MSEVLSLQEVLKRINKEQGSTVISTGVKELTESSYISLGSPSLDCPIYNSFPERRIIEICGQEAAGKTTLAYLACAGFQKKELKRHPDNPRKILWVDLEFTADSEWACKMSYDMNDSPVQTLYFKPEDLSAEEIFDYIVSLVRTGDVGIVVSDSLSMLVSQQVYDKSFEQKEMGGIAKVLGDFVKRITSLLVKYDCTLIGLNQLRENIGGYGNPLVTSGGRAWKHACSLRLMVKKGKFLDADNNELSNNAESPAGYIMEVAVLKSKVCPWDRKLGYTYVSYTRGIDILQDTIEVATHFGLISNPSQGQFVILNPDTGEALLDDEGEPVKIRGKKNIKPYLEEHLDIWHKLYNKVYDKLSQKNDHNIVSFEKMLGINVGEAFGVDFAKEEE